MVLAISVTTGFTDGIRLVWCVRVQRGSIRIKMFLTIVAVLRASSNVLFAKTRLLNALSVKLDYHEILLINLLVLVLPIFMRCREQIKRLVAAV
jgi:hypothetical protein